MMMTKDENGDITLEFIKRTKVNWDIIQGRKAENPQGEHFEVTQMINSMLGMIVFPKERVLKQFKNKCLSELAAVGWPEFIIPEKYGVKNLWELIRHLRNSIAHTRFDLDSGENNEISKIQFKDAYTDSDYNKGEYNFELDLTIEEIKMFLNKYYEYINEAGNRVDYTNN